VNTHAHVILRESYLVPGETFDSARLKATQQRLENMGYFKNVNVYAVRAQDDQSLGSNYRDVYIEVEETTTGSASLFAGFSSADDLFGGLDLSENNFNYKGLGQVFTKGPSAIRGGGEYAHARFSIGAKQRTYLFSWLDPYFRDTLWRVGFDVNKTFSDLVAKNYTIDTVGGSVFASYPLNPYWTFGTKYRVKYSDVDIDKKLHHRIKEERKKQEEKKKNGTFNPHHKADELPPENNILSGLSTSISFDSTDSSLKPRNGFRSSLEAEIAGFGGDVYFLRFGYVNSYYTALWAKGTMKYRFDFRYIQPIGSTSNPNDIPISERFFLGGQASVRGYRDFSLGPQYDTKDPTGGISSSLLSVEYLQNIVQRLDAFVFADAGSVSLKRFAIPHYNISYGFGVRVELMNRMPFIFGLGFPINPSHHHQRKQFFFSMGGQF
jgi:outer membrane protein insertion porin family